MNWMVSSRNLVNWNEEDIIPTQILLESIKTAKMAQK
jgi:hypothetical protein